MSADSQTLDLLRQAIRWGYLTQQQAEHCVQFAAQNQRNALEVAQSYQLLTPEQIQTLLKNTPRPQSSTAPNAHATPRPKNNSGSASDSRKASDSGPRLPSLGTNVDGYVIKRLLGQGGMGAVFEGEMAGASFALKFITSQDSRAMERFEREAHAAAAVDSHRHIVSIHKYAVWQDYPYVVMDFVPGVSLSDRLSEERRSFSTEQSFELIGKMADALNLVHSKGILHRDIKPANILLREGDEEPLLTDFGLAFVREAKTLTKTAEMLGTPHYMAPEQASTDRNKLGPGTDIWALGVILYELLAGELPFTGQTLVEISASILLKDPDPPSKKNAELNAGMDAVVLKCLEKNPKARYQTAKDLAADCQAVFQGGPITASRSGLFGRAGRRLLRRTGRLGASLLFLSILTIVLGPILWFKLSRQDQLDESVALEINTQFEGLKKSARELNAQLADHFAHHALQYRQESIKDPKKDPVCEKVDQYLIAFKDFEQKAIVSLKGQPKALDNLVGQKELTRL
ncbi:MAG: serine/threonine-protein kinase, partial [Planctomycetota bacterium]|nr:serine/threonine-protein kinase [Planctomycetota bacterium]